MPRPIRAKYTIPYGAQFGAPRAGGSRIHQGCDYHCPIGTPIYGTGPGGVVTHIGYNGDVNSGSGHNITVTYPGARITTDMHMRERTPLHVGSAVDANTIVGYVGITGNAVNASPPGSHDHHQVTVNGKLVDPESVYGTSLAGDAGTLITEQDDDMLRFITRDSTSPWFVTDGLTKRYVAPGEDQLLVDLGLAVREADGQPKLLGANIDLIPDAVRVVGPDPAAIAVALAPLLPDTVDEAALVALIAPAVAKAVNDDAANRLRA